MYSEPDDGIAEHDLGVTIAQHSSVAPFIACHATQKIQSPCTHHHLDCICLWCQILSILGMGRFLGLIYILSQSCAGASFKVCKHSANNSWLNLCVTEEGLSSEIPHPHTHLFVSSTFLWQVGEGLHVFFCWLLPALRQVFTLPYSR